MKKINRFLQKMQTCRLQLGDTPLNQAMCRRKYGESSHDKDQSIEVELCVRIGGFHLVNVKEVSLVPVPMQRLLFVSPNFDEQSFSYILSFCNYTTLGILTRVSHSWRSCVKDEMERLHEQKEIIFYDMTEAEFDEAYKHRFANSANQ